MTTVAPAATKITIPTVSSVKDVPRGSQIRIPRAVQLQLARSLTFGVIGENSNLYPSSKWQTEKQDVYANRLAEVSRGKPDFVITSLDTRKHNPQTKNLFHIKRISTKPVCGVEAWGNGKTPAEGYTDASTVYRVSFKDDIAKDTSQRLVHKQINPKRAEAIVPVNMTGSKFDVRTEMMLPICDSTTMPSAHNPHRYLLRKRKVPPPFKSPRRKSTDPNASANVYPSLEKPRMTSFVKGEIPSGDLPFETQRNQASEYPDDYPDRTSISSLSGMSFSRRKYIQPPMGHILGSCVPVRPMSPTCISSLAGKRFTRRRIIPHPLAEIGFDAGSQRPTISRFDDRNLPYIRAKTII